jgi:hypothetical protein
MRRPCSRQHSRSSSFAVVKFQTTIVCGFVPFADCGSGLVWFFQRVETGSVSDQPCVGCFFTFVKNLKFYKIITPQKSDFETKKNSEFYFNYLIYCEFLIK